MPNSKPYHRNYRAIKPGPNSGYSDWAYIVDRQYAINAEHYVRAFLLIQDDLRTIFEYLEPSTECENAYSYRIHALFMRTCIEIEANFKAILEENIFSGTGRLTISHFRKVDATHHLSSYEVMLPIWNGTPPTWRPFEEWRPIRGQSCPQNVSSSLRWYRAYNESKHDRQDKFKEANLGNLIEAVAALLVLISSQFRVEDFAASDPSLGTDGNGYHPMAAAIGSLFRIKFPDDWSDDELYDFNWAELRNETHRFEKLNFDSIPM